MSIKNTLLQQHLQDLKTLRSHFKKIPSNLDIERCVLGSILLSQETQYRLSELKVNDFYDEKHAIVCFYMHEMTLHNKQLDFYTVADHIAAGKPITSNKQYFDTFSSYFNSLMTESFVIQSLDAYIRILLDKTKLRKVLLASIQVGQLITNEDISDVQAIMQSINQIWTSTLSQNNQQNNILSPKDILPDDFSNYIDSLNAKSTDQLTTGFIGLDHILGGLAPGGVYIVAGRPSMGKTTLGMNMIEALIIDNKNTSGLVFSLEMSIDDILLRSLCSIARVTKSIIQQGDFMPEEVYRDVEDTYHRIKDSKLYLHEEDLDLSTLLQVSRHVKRMQPNLSVILIDYIQLMASQHKAGSVSRQQEIADISRAIKLLAKELKLPIIVISQLNRNVDDRNDRRPILSDLRESGALEQDADAVIFLYRDEVYNKDSLTPNQAEISVRKNRHGPLGSIMADFKGAQFRFNEVQIDQELYIV